MEVPAIIQMPEQYEGRKIINFRNRLTSFSLFLNFDMSLQVVSTHGQRIEFFEWTFFSATGKRFPESMQRVS